MIEKVDLVVLDRDDTIVQVPVGQRYQYGESPIILCDGAAEFIRHWNSRSVPVVVATNQQGIALPEYPGMNETSVDKFNLRINSRLMIENAHIDAFFVCPHAARQNCLCRKPKPGLILAAINRFYASPERTWVIGDKVSDVEAGIAAGAKVIYLSSHPQHDNRYMIATDLASCLELLRAY